VYTYLNLHVLVYLQASIDALNYMFVYMYKNIHTHLQRYKYICVYVLVHIYIYTCSLLYMCTSTYTHMYLYRCRFVLQKSLIKETYILDLCVCTCTYIQTYSLMHRTYTYMSLNYTYICIWICMYAQVQPIPLEVTFSNAVAKLKARTSLFTETWQKRRSSFELWAFENVTASGIGYTCTYVQVHIHTCTARQSHIQKPRCRYVYMYFYVCLCTCTCIHLQYNKVYKCMHICTSTYTHMGWLRSVGSIELQVSFAEYRLFYRALLQKRPII